MRTRSANTARSKAHGVHYTPPELAQFLAERTVAAWTADESDSSPLSVLDPACGDGGLLEALTVQLPTGVRSRLTLEGFEIDGAAVGQAQTRLARLAVAQVLLHHCDFLDHKPKARYATGGREGADGADLRYDIVIANPPYVRTQVLGARRAQELARRFGLSGRVDLSHAFIMGMVQALKPGGTLGLLTSNRFLTVRAGEAIRTCLAEQFDLLAIYDLGDTRLFEAAVLPVIITGRKQAPGGTCQFHRVYELRGDRPSKAERRSSAMAAIGDHELVGVVETPGKSLRIERGHLLVQDGRWLLGTETLCNWLETVRDHQAATFGEVGQIRVGVKTTADEVFIRSNWQTICEQQRPEPGLLRPLLTHHVAARWRAGQAAKTILYPHEVSGDKPVAVNLEDYPHAAAYLKRHKERLSRRNYLSAAGRNWYEIWVPQHPGGWRLPKLVYPEISEHPRFFLDESGAIVNGDCYWITLRPGIHRDWLLLMLAVANSSFTTRFYDAVFHNKLYAGRRRFMTQYVSHFPLPDLCRARAVLELTRRRLEAGASLKLEDELDGLVWELFGLKRG